jgi:hypothetical protein
MIRQPEPTDIKDAGAPGYFIGVSMALDFQEADVPEALQLFWNNHIGIARSLA